MAAWRISSLGIGYTPQGRRLWPSLTVDEHLRLVEFGGSWTVSRIYETFPRLAERRRSGAGQLSGGEQQMLAISRALLQDPQLLILDEPTEGLAPLIVEQVEQLLTELASEQDVSVLLIEQKISVATAVAKNIAVMVNGRIGRIIPAEKLAGDRTLQEQLLGVGRHSHEDFDLPASPESEPASTETSPENSTALPLSSEGGQDGVDEKSTDSTAYVPPMRWSNTSWSERPDNQPSSGESKITQISHRPFDTKLAPLLTESRVTPASSAEKSVYVAGTFDTKGTELRLSATMPASAFAPLAKTCLEMRLSPWISVTEYIIMMSDEPTYSATSPDATVEIITLGIPIGSVRIAGVARAVPPEPAAEMIPAISWQF